MVAGGHAWLGGVHGCGGVCMVAGGVHGCWGACVVARGHSWLPGGMHGCWGACRGQSGLSVCMSKRRRVVIRPLSGIPPSPYHMDLFKLGNPNLLLSGWVVFDWKAFLLHWFHYHFVSINLFKSHNVREIKCQGLSPILVSAFIGGCKGAPGTRPLPLGVQILSFSCSFRQKIDKIIPIWELAHPPRENPGFATDLESSSTDRIWSSVLRMLRNTKLVRLPLITSFYIT